MYTVKAVIGCAACDPHGERLICETADEHSLDMLEEIDWELQRGCSLGHAYVGSFALENQEHVYFFAFEPINGMRFLERRDSSDFNNESDPSMN